MPESPIDLLANQRTLVMGIVNTTPDSFSDGGKHLDKESCCGRGPRNVKRGRGHGRRGRRVYETGSMYVDTDEELRRAIPVIEEIHRQRPEAYISIDTRRRVVAEAALAAGASMINDVSGFRDEPT